MCLISSGLYARTIKDTYDVDLTKFFSEPGATYVISHSHTTADTVRLPSNATLKFKGNGCISAPIIFDNTTLKGKVRLQGSTIKGTIRNTTFNARWLCHADGKHDDAANINQILAICNNVHFAKGTYLLQSFHKPPFQMNKPFHIGIARSHTHITGDKGAVLRTATMAGTLWVYSKPYDIPNNISNISIRGITFEVINESPDFDKYQEHCHTISIRGVRGMVIENCRFRNFWGDAICTDHYNDNEKTGERARNVNVLIQNNYIDGYRHSNRNGVSIINGKNITVRNNTIVNSSHRTMPGAIDVEANNTAYTIDSLVIEGNRIDNSQGFNAAISLISNYQGAPMHNIIVRNNVITRSFRGLAFMVQWDNVTDNITVEGNTVDKETDPYIFWGKGKTKNWHFIGNDFKAPAKQKLGGDLKIEGYSDSNNKIRESAWLKVSTVLTLLVSTIIILVRRLINSVTKARNGSHEGSQR